MKKYLFLSSAFLMTMAGANAADKIITSANTCTVDVLGVSDNNATANTIATWDLIDYTLAPGEYLKVTDTSVTEITCPAGSYCVGGGYTVETANNSIAQCPTTHPNSATGAGAQTQCYTACTLASANIAHATAVSGNDYYGTGTDTCGATACETGYHVDGEVELVEKTPLIPVNYETAGNGNYAYIDSDGNYSFSDTLEDVLTANGTWVSEFDYGRVYGKASCQPKRNPVVEYFKTNIDAFNGGEITIEEFKLGLESLVGKNKAEYVISRMNDIWGDEAEQNKVLTAVGFMTESDANYTIDSTGQYCYCQMDGFAPIDDKKTDVLSAPWVLLGNAWFLSADECASSCAEFCSSELQYESYFRAAMFGALEAMEIGRTCTANTINIDWNPDNNGAHIKNMCTYDGSITVPADPVKPGYTFMGWKLVE